jgi:hypothetical protein
MKVMNRNPLSAETLFSAFHVAISKGPVHTTLQIPSPKTQWLLNNLNECEIHVKRKYLLPNSAK